MDRPWRKGTKYLRQAAAEGSALAAYELGETPSVPTIAAQAGAGNLEAIEALGCLMQQGRGGKANRLMACMVWGQGIRLLREGGDPAEGWRQDALSRLYQLRGEDKKAFHWLAVAGEKSKYPPAMYRLCLRPEIRRSTQYVSEAADAMRKAGFPKAHRGEALTYWEGWEQICAQSLQETPGGGDQTRNYAKGRTARLTQLVMDPEFIARYPEKAAEYDGTLKDILEDEKARLAILTAPPEKKRGQPAPEPEDASSPAAQMPWMIFDEYGRSWEKDGAVPGKYNLSGNYTPDSLDNAMMFLHPFSTEGGDGVVIRDGDISGRKASAGGHDFSW